jgi:ABC-type bacteriocin/lantibiotic exporter with double-glycine peptidase domain
MSTVVDMSPAAINISSPEAIAVHLQGVSYTYPQSDKVALAEICYAFHSGTTAIVGPNGAGKSTLVKLLTGLLEPTSGSIRVQQPGGACLPPHELHKAVLFQEPSHLYLTVRQNITMRFERTPNEEARIYDALEIAGLGKVVKGLPDGIDTLVGAGFGGQLDLSGGQWQRLALARLIYQDAPVMILDEPVASLDPEGERAVFKLFSQLTHNKVIIFTTHRYDSIPKNTKIVVLVDGRITETGTHEELLQRERDYWSLYMSSSPTARKSLRMEERVRSTAAVAPQNGREALPQPEIAGEQPLTPRSPYWLITRMSELDQHDLELMEAIRKSGVKLNSFATKNIAAELVRG